MSDPLSEIGDTPESRVAAWLDNDEALRIPDTEWGRRLYADLRSLIETERRLTASDHEFSICGCGRGIVRHLKGDGGWWHSNASIPIDHTAHPSDVRTPSAPTRPCATQPDLECACRGGMVGQIAATCLRAREAARAARQVATSPEQEARP